MTHPCSTPCEALTGLPHRMPASPAPLSPKPPPKLLLLTKGEGRATRRWRMLGTW